MNYLGSKRRVAKNLSNKMGLHNLSKDRYYVEPFVGGANMMSEVRHPLRIGADINEYLVVMWQKLQEGWKPPSEISEKLYYDIKYNKNKYPKELVGFVGFNCSFSSRWFDTYSRGDSRNYALNGKKSIEKQMIKLRGVNFIHSSYKELDIPDNSLVYCDPPYKGTHGYEREYKDDWYTNFWVWVRLLSSRCEVYISEYQAPKDFEIVYQKNLEIRNDPSDHKMTVEKLFRYKGK